MCASVQSLKYNLKFILINVYGPKSCIGKKSIWDELSLVFLNYNDSPIVMGGDFNTILSLDGKVGGMQHLALSSLEFKAWIDKHSLIEISLSNGSYTWNNKRKDEAYIVENLDRFFIVGSFTDYNKNF